MELAATTLPRARARAAALRLDRRAIGAWTLGFAPVLYLTLRGGGYDLIVRSEAGIAAWWIVIVGLLAGALSLSRIGRLAWVSVALLGAFALWTGIATAWSPSAERTVAELGRLAAYLGFFVLGLCVLRRDTLRHLVGGMAVAFGVVSLLAVLSRLYPSAFPSDQVAVFFPGSQERLNYPLNYANGTGNFLAIGIPLLLVVATRARTLARQALGAAAVPIAVLGIVLTASRGGALTAVVAIAAFYALSPDRLPKLATGLAAAAGSAILVAALLHRSALRDGLSTPSAVSQRHQLMLLLVVASVGVGLVQVGIGLAVRFAERPRSLKVGRQRAASLTATGIAIALAVGIAAGVPGKLAHQWQLFKHTDVTGVVAGNVYSRLGTVTGSHRYQYWQTALHAYRSRPLTGIGPGTFGLYWARHGPIYEFIQNAHSLYLETLAETGLVGFALIVSLLAVLLASGVIRTLRAPPLARASLAAATASLAAFCAAAGYDWMWQLAVAPVAALLLGAAILAYRDVPRAPVSTGWRALAPRGVAAAVALAAMIAIAIPFAATSAVRSSQAEAQAGHVRAALADATTAQRLEPYAATPRLQRALILEAAGDLRDARVAIAQAAARESTNWQIWLIRARIDAESGQAAAAVRDYRRAHMLNPLSPTTSLHA
jgi:O-Antigen ligase